MLTGLSWKAETHALGKIKRAADKSLGLVHAQHGHVRSETSPLRSAPAPPRVRPKVLLPAAAALWSCIIPKARPVASQRRRPRLSHCLLRQVITHADRKWAKSLQKEGAWKSEFHGLQHLAL
jgi:hypothetical protein